VAGNYSCTTGSQTVTTTLVQNGNVCEAGELTLNSDGTVGGMQGATWTGSSAGFSICTSDDGCLVCSPVVPAEPIDCGGGFTDCGGTCSDLSSDPDNCGSCGTSCAGNQCIDGVCIGATCVNLGACATDAECCELFCTSNGTCGCIPDGDDTQFCNANVDCCSGSCDTNTGYCTG